MRFHTCNKVGQILCSSSAAVFKSSQSAGEFSADLGRLDSVLQRLRDNAGRKA